MSFIPRQYQNQAINGSIQRFDAGDRATLLVMGTGTGKTVVFSHVADAFVPKGRIMVLAHRDELVRQAAKKLHAVTGHFPEIEKGDEWANEDSLHGKSMIVVSSFQTQISGGSLLTDEEKVQIRNAIIAGESVEDISARMTITPSAIGKVLSNSKARMERFNPKEFSLLIVDEAHHAMAKSFMAVIRYYMDGNPDLRVLCVTATAKRGDGKSLGELCSSVAFCYEIKRAILDGYLVPVRQKTVFIPEMDLSKCGTQAGDLNPEDRDAIMLVEGTLHGIAHATIEAACQLPKGTLEGLLKDVYRIEKLREMIQGKPIKRSLVFNSGIEHAKLTADIINRWIPDSAQYVAGQGGEFGMDMKVRQNRLKIFSEGAAVGQFPFLCNCDVLSEGYDESTAELVAMGKPTKVQGKYIQWAGRVTRPLEEIAHHLDILPGKHNRDMIAASRKPHCLILDFAGNAGRHKLITAADIFAGAKPRDVIDWAAKMSMTEEGIDVEEALRRAAAEIDAERKPRQEAAEKLFEEMAAEEERLARHEAARRMKLVAASNYEVNDVDAFDNQRSEPERIQQGGASDKQIEMLAKLDVPRKTATGYSVRQAWSVISSLKEKRCTNPQVAALRRAGYGREEIEAMNFAAASAAIDASRKGEVVR